MLFVGRSNNFDIFFSVQPLGEHSIENLQLSGDKGLETSSVTKSNAESTPAAIQTIALSDSPSGKVQQATYLFWFEYIYVAMAG